METTINKIHHVASSTEDILNFASFCKNIDQIAECKIAKCDIKIFTSIISTFFIMPDKTVNDRK